MSQFNVSLIVWAKSQDSVHKPQFLKRKESRSRSNQGPSAYQPSALPLGHTGSLPSDGGAVKVYILGYKATEVAHSFYPLPVVCVCLYGPFNYISFHKLSQQLPVFSLCSSGLISVLLVLSTIYLLMRVSLSPDIILCG